MRYSVLVAVAAATLGLAVGLAACGSDDEGDNTPEGSGGGGASDAGGQGGTAGEDGTGGEDLGEAGTGGTDDTGGSGGSAGEQCTAIESLSGAEVSELADERAILEAEIVKPEIDGVGRDLLGVEVYSWETGTFALGTGINHNFADCEQCVFVWSNVESTQAGGKDYFAADGSINLSTDDEWETVTIKFNNVTFREFDYDTDSFVTDGSCITLNKEVVFDSYPF